MLSSESLLSNQFCSSPVSFHFPDLIMLIHFSIFFLVLKYTQSNELFLIATKQTFGTVLSFYIVEMAESNLKYSNKLPHTLHSNEHKLLVAFSNFSFKSIFYFLRTTIQKFSRKKPLQRDITQQKSFFVKHEHELEFNVILQNVNGSRCTCNRLK